MESQEVIDNHSEEEENDINFLNTNKKQNKFKIIDSDSEQEVSESLENKICEDHGTKSLTEEEKISHNCNDNEDIQLENSERNTKHNRISEDSEDEVTPHNKSFPDEETAEAVIYTTDGKGNFIPENVVTNSVQKPLSSLCDADTSEEEEPHQSVNEDIIDETDLIQPKVYKPPRKRNRNNQPNKMTVQEAIKQKTEIQSESQRMIRESNVSLPYHKPKSYTIKEFLQKRSKLASAMPLIPKAPPCVAIKMSKDKLEEISKTLDKRIKQVEEFYKSESEDEEKNEKEAATEEIRSWLFVLVNNAMDIVEKEVEITNKIIEETENKITEIGSVKSPEECDMEYEFNLEDINEEKPKRPNFSKLIEEKLLNVQPKLSGCPDDVIDLETGITKQSDVKKLVEKYFQNTVKKVPHKHRVELDIIGFSGKGEIIKETVSMNVVEEEEPVMVETPGAKLQKLREELQNQIAQRRSELWKQKQEQGDIFSTEKKSEIESEGGGEKDLLDDDEEEEMEMTESESEDYEEEDDVDLKPEKQKPKSVFIEDEADEEDMEEDDDFMSNNDDVDENNEEPEDEENDGFDGDDEEPPQDKESETCRKKNLKRIIKPFTEDSDDDDDDEEPTRFTLVLKSADKSSHDSTASVEEEFIPPNLPCINKTPQRHHNDNNKSELDFLTPVTYLTGLQNLSSDSRFSKDSPIISPFRTPLGISPLKETQESPHVQKNIFLEQPESTQEAQDNLDELANICSGKFPETQGDSNTQDKKVAEDVPSTQELLNICSGGFSTELVPDDHISKTKNRDSEKVVITIEPHADKEIKNLDEDHDQIISQLLDEDELERFKKKFESPVISASQKKWDLKDTDEVNATGLINSDEENEELEVIKKKGHKKLVFSDDDGTSEQDEEDYAQENEEEIDLHDEDDEEQLLEDEAQLLEEEAQEKRPLKATDFFDEEAELSESDWGSADEDEKGLDDLEFEQGDEENFDENKVRSELERIHMRQVLDKDNREVKLLQELLLEDGEMHGSGRQRQFRWKTLDSAGNTEFEKREDDDIFLDEEENEEQWRKMRHKRESFLKKKSDSDDVEIILSNSQILNVGAKVIIKNTPSFSSQHSTTSDVSEPKEKDPFSLLSTRGSFLKRNDEVLQRLAEYNKVTEGIAESTVKNSKHFVFQTIQSTESATVKVSDNNNKRKATDTTPRSVKRLRLNNFSPGMNKKPPQKANSFKNFYGNW